jgi:hypothetical protein
MPIDIPEELLSYLKERNVEWEWFDMRERFWPENRKETFKIFSDFPVGQVFYCNTTFDGFQQLELMIELFYKLIDKKFTLKIDHGCLDKDLLEFYSEKRSTLVPSDASAKENSGYKKIMNRKFLDVLKAHDIWWIPSCGDEVLFKTLSDIKKSANKYNTK